MGLKKGGIMNIKELAENLGLEDGSLKPTKKNNEPMKKNGSFGLLFFL